MLEYEINVIGSILLFAGIFVMGYINRWRGATDPFSKDGGGEEKWYGSKGACAVYVAIFYSLATQNYVIGALSGLFWWAWAVTGWGLYFMSHSGWYWKHPWYNNHTDKIPYPANYDPNNLTMARVYTPDPEPETDWIDSRVDRQLGVPKTTQEAYAWGRLAMAFRGLYIAPLIAFLVYTVYLNIENASAVFAIIAFIVFTLVTAATQGYLYYYRHKDYGKVDLVAVAERETGHIHGLVFLLILAAPNIIRVIFG